MLIFALQLFCAQSVVKMKLPSQPILLLVILSCCCVGVTFGVPVNNGTVTREFTTAYDCQWVTKCAHEVTGDHIYHPCKEYLAPKYECLLKPTVNLSDPPCLVGYVLNEKNKCMRFIL